MGIKADYEQAKADFMRLKDLCDGNVVYDYCGGWCNNDDMDSLLENPTKKNAMQQYKSLITRYFDTGIDLHDKAKPIDINHPEVYEILKRNGDVG